jgi:hypothetical protein
VGLSWIFGVPFLSLPLPLSPLEESVLAVQHIVAGMS